MGNLPQSITADLVRERVLPALALEFEQHGYSRETIDSAIDAFGWATMVLPDLGSVIDENRALLCLIRAYAKS